MSHAPLQHQHDLALTIGEAPCERVTQARRGRSAKLLQPIAWRVLRRCVLTYHRLEITGTDHLPIKPPFVMVANHTSHLDTAVLMCSLPFNQLSVTHPIAAQDTFFNSPVRAAISRSLSNAIPIRRGHADLKALAALRKRLINDNEILILYPEGTRGDGTQTRAFQAGIGLLVAGTDIPVVPCHIRGCERAMPKGSVMPRPAKLSVNIGRPRVYADLPPRKSSWQRVAEDLYDTVEAL